MLVLTPQCFVDVLVLGLYWEHWPPTPRHGPKGRLFFRSGWTTADHVLKILLNLNVINKGHIKMVQDKTLGREHQRKLNHHCSISYGSTYATNSSSLFLCQQGNSRGNPVPLLRLVRDQRLELLPQAADKVPMIDEQYQELGLLKDPYLAMSKQIDAGFKTEAASANASMSYRKRIAHELDEMRDQ